jgi:hypothetical protein
MATVHQAVSPEGILHLVPDEQRPKKAFCDAHGLRVAYFNKYVVAKGTESGGWQLLAKVKYLQHVASRAIVVVVGKPKQFFDGRAAALAHAGLAEEAMPFEEHELRQFERLLDLEDSSVEEMAGWKPIAEPPVVATLVADVACPKCACATANLNKLLNRPATPPPAPGCRHVGTSASPPPPSPPSASEAAAAERERELAAQHFQPIMDLSRSHFQPMADFTRDNAKAGGRMVSRVSMPVYHAARSDRRQ